MKKLKTLIPLLLIILTILVGTVIYLYEKPVEKSTTKAADYKISAAQLYQDYQNDQKLADQRYLGKVIEVKGLVTSLQMTENGSVSVNLKGSEEEMFGVSCQFAPELAAELGKIKEGEEVDIKGECSGKLMDVVLTHSALIEN